MLFGLRVYSGEIGDGKVIEIRFESGIVMIRLIYLAKYRDKILVTT